MSKTSLVVGSLLAIALAFMGLRVSKRRLLSARGREWPVLTEKELLRALGAVRGETTPPDRKRLWWHLL
jgi:hypothetical protein